MADAKSRVLAQYPDAFSERSPVFGWRIFSRPIRHPYDTARLDAHNYTEAEAWEDAASRLAPDPAPMPADSDEVADAPKYGIPVCPHCGDSIFAHSSTADGLGCDARADDGSPCGCEYIFPHAQHESATSAPMPANKPDFRALAKELAAALEAIAKHQKIVAGSMPTTVAFIADDALTRYREATDAR